MRALYVYIRMYTRSVVVKYLSERAIHPRQTMAHCNSFLCNMLYFSLSSSLCPSIVRSLPVSLYIYMCPGALKSSIIFRNLI